MNRIKEGELARKVVHYNASLIPIIYYFFVDRKIALIVLGVCSASIILAEVLRMRNPLSKNLYMKIFGWMTRSHEHNKHFTGASYVFVGSFLTILLFPKEIAVIVLLFLSVGDPTACLVGLSIGKVKIWHDKTLEGSLAFIIAGFLVTFWIPGIALWVKVIGAFVACFVELIPWKVDDNITIPLITGIILIVLK